MKTTIYTRNNCAACIGTKKQFEIRGVDFFEINVENDPSRFLAQELVDAGWRQMPVVRVDFEDGDTVWWSGTDLAAIKAVSQGLKP